MGYLVNIEIILNILLMLLCYWYFDEILAGVIGSGFHFPSKTEAKALQNTF